MCWMARDAFTYVLPDGTERPVAFASRTLISSERNYTQVEKEALSLIFGVKRFHSHLYSRSFTIVTDHKPLTTILGYSSTFCSQTTKVVLDPVGISVWDWISPTGDHGNADGLSRLPLSDVPPEETNNDSKIFNISQMEVLPVTVRQLCVATHTDRILSKVYHYTKGNWPHQVPQYLMVEEGCLLRGIRVIIPHRLREKLREELHKDHPGVCPDAYSKWPEVSHVYYHRVSNTLNVLRDWQWSEVEETHNTDQIKDCILPAPQVVQETERPNSDVGVDTFEAASEVSAPVPEPVASNSPESPGAGAAEGNASNDSSVEETTPETGQSTTITSSFHLLIGMTLLVLELIMLYCITFLYWVVHLTLHTFSDWCLHCCMHSCLLIWLLWTSSFKKGGELYFLPHLICVCQYCQFSPLDSILTVGVVYTLELLHVHS